LNQDLKPFFLTTNNETILWKKVAADDKEAFDQLYRNNVKALYNYGSKFTQNTASIEDCIQQLFLNLWNSRKNLKINSFRSYLFISYKNLLVKKIQANSKSIPIEFSPELMAVQSTEDRLIAAETALSNKSQIELAMDDLSNRQKEAIYLKFYEKLEYEQISEIMSIKIPAVYKLISSALQRLKKKL
jgi:RNA polymerase sigma factor (sigma-70 family)